MDEKSLRTLEYEKILERLASFTAFPASREKALALRPTSDLVAARQRQKLTGEARLLLDTQDVSIGGARDVRALADRARHGLILDPHELLDVKFTLISARQMARTFERLEAQFPHLFDLASQLPPPLGIVDSISRAISERGDILDSASPALSSIRKEIRIVHDRLNSRLQRMVSDPKNAPYLQEALVTQRDGRFVIPLRAEFKGRIKSIVHDQSSSGATLFVEPLAVVELNNQYRELFLQERDEERRILAALSQRIGEHAYEIEQAVDVIAELDVVFACAKYAYHLRATEPVLHPIQPRVGTLHPGTLIRLFGARHPLLDPVTVVPIDMELDEQTYSLVITGPNTGGKTVSLKTAGLLVLMAQSGLHIPAQSGSELSCFEQVFADIGDEQSIEQSLSTFSGHITNIIRILAAADQRSLVILDELGAGTDPQEGAALARALLTHLMERGITTLVTTHHPELKAYAHTTPGIVNASVEFDLQTLRPTFHLTIGLPGRSNALAIAQRLGMPEAIIAEAKKELNPEELQVGSLLDEIHRQRELARAARTAAEASQQEAEHLRHDLARRLEQIEDERRALLESARVEAQQQVETLQAELREARRLLARARQPLDALKTIEAKVDELEEVLESPVERQEPELPAGMAVSPPRTRVDKSHHRPIKLGSKVFLRSLGTQGVVITLGEEEAEVQVGMMRVRARRTDLEHVREAEALSEQPPATRKERKAPPVVPEVERKDTIETGASPSPGIELDLRGQRVEEALEMLDRHLDAAFLAGLPWVRIIHGKGTGRLRDAVRQVLTQNAYVKSHQKGVDGEGGDGVTVAYLRG
jgi:DNA mismatch repair protein MutS2